MSAITREIVIEIVEVDNPEVYATQAATSATAAATSATSAATSATNAATSATAAATSATNAATSATSAASSATAAASSATSAGTQATNAATSATAAATSATAAASSATAATANGAAQVALAEAQVALATTQANNAAASFDSFDDRYLGAKSSNPSVDNDGNALLTGALYWNTTVPEMRVWNGSAWVNVPFSIPAHGHDWADITGEPATFPPSTHGHDWADITGEPATFPPSTHGHDWADITNKPATFPPSSHGHAVGEITGLGTAATLNVAASGNASANEVVKGNDTRLSGGGGGGVGGMKNRIINGEMRIDQRNAGAAITPTAATYTVDRWSVAIPQPSKLEIGRNLNAISPPAGFSNYIGMKCVSQYSIITSDNFCLLQRVEGHNIYDLDFGKATAKTISLSFWVNSSITGTFGGSIRNRTGTRSYPFSYTVNSAGTWERKTFIIPGDTSGSWDTTSDTIGLNVFLGIAVASPFLGTANAWASANFLSCTGATSLLSTLNATLYITGVQLEASNTATDFEWRDYGRELAMCQRYCAVFSAGAAYVPLGAGVAWSTTTARIVVNTAAMRSSKTITTNAGTAIYLNANGGLVASTAISLIYQGEAQTIIDVTCAGLTVGQGVLALINTNSWLRIEAEL